MRGVFRALTVIGIAASAAGQSVAETSELEWRTIGRGVANGESLIVRASWIRSEPATQESSFVEYRVERPGGRLVWSEALIGLGEGDWCDSFDCSLTPWRSGMVIRLSRACWPSYLEAGEVRFLYVARDTLALCDWDRNVAWSPPSDSGSYWGEESGINLRIPVRVVVDRSRITFVDALPPGAAHGEPFRVEVSGYAYFGFGNEDPERTIVIYPNADSRQGERYRIPPETGHDLLSAIVRVTKGGDARVGLVRVEIRVGSRHGWIDPADLSILGWGW